ncbi:MAG: hypothetical protein LBH80_08530 [Prevotellaceae bacterium]|jgi:uncharacterized protein (DUF342 family)|nr:hypothetical protein [Prevotellaceae bacterium]
MKKLIVLSLAALLAGFISVMAQEQHKGKEAKPLHGKETKDVHADLKGMDRLDKMLEKLDLTDRQYEELKALLKKQVEQRHAKRAEMKVDREKERAEMEAEIINIIGQEKFDLMKSLQKPEMSHSAKKIDDKKIKQLDNKKPARMIEQKKLPEKN